MRPRIGSRDGSTEADSHMASIRLKPLDQQTIVITGASSGIGLATAELAAECGAQLVLAARSIDALDRIAEDLRRHGVQVATCKADVGDQSDVEAIARTAIEKFGGFDTWVNNAGVSAYGRLDQVTIEDQRRLFDTDYWGVVYGSLAALEHLRSRGGAIINIGSVLSEVAFPLQGAYSAAKHAVKGFTDALRLELEEADLPIAVTLIKPASVDTPYEKHAANYLEVEPKNPPPYAAPELVAEAILKAAATPTRENYVGPGSWAMPMAYHLAPGLSDRAMGHLAAKLQRTSDASDSSAHRGLHSAGRDGATRGGHWLVVGPGLARAQQLLAIGAGLGLLVALAGVARARSR
jgi:short-subunit dehydrogenase